MLEASIVVKPSFYDLDPMQIVWHGNYARFMEDARCALLDLIGFGYTEMRKSGFMWPIVDIRIKYVRPIHLQQEVRVVATLLEYENRIRIAYRFVDVVSDETLTKAQTTQIAVTLDTNEMMFESPTILVEKVQRLL